MYHKQPLKLNNKSIKPNFYKESYSSHIDTIPKNNNNIFQSRKYFNPEFELQVKDKFHYLINFIIVS